MRVLSFSLVFIATKLASDLRAENPPNVILIVADDLGYGEKNGVRFTSGYVSAPYCAASRAGLLTGRYQTRFGFECNPVGARNEAPGTGLPVDQQTLADILRNEAGYSIALIGKWHLGGTADFHPMRRGFDEFFGFLHEGRFFRPFPYAGMSTWLRR